MRDGAAVYLEAFMAGLRLDPILLVTDWAAQYRYLAPKGSPEPGRYRPERTPFWREVMDALSKDSLVQEVVVMKGAQIGFSEAAYCWLGYIMHQAPAPTLLVMPSVELAHRTSKTRIAPMIEVSPVLRERVRDPRSRDSGNTLLSKEFPGGFLLLTGANSAAGLRSTPVKNLFMDEEDGYPKDVDGEGSPAELAKRRTATFPRRKILRGSTPTLRGDSAIETAFLETDQRYYHVPCPRCEHFQALRWKGLKWEKDDTGRVVPGSVRYVCEACGGAIKNHEKTGMLARGRWIPSNPVAASERVRGYHLSALYSPVGWYSWEEAVTDWYKAQKNPARLRTFINTVLGESFEVRGDDAPQWRDLYDRREDRPLGVVPRRAAALTAAVDVQKDRLEFKVMGWNRRESWIVDRVVVMGDTSLPPGHGPWKELDELLERDWPREGGGTLRLRVTLIDSGYNTAAVYAFVRTKHAALVRAIKGKDTLEMPIASPRRTEVRKSGDGKRLKRGGRVWSVGTNLLKADVTARLKIRRPTDGELAKDGFPPTYVHLPPLDEEYFKQLCAEAHVLVPTKRGHAAYQWVKTYPNNEAFDLLCYNVAAWYAAGLARLTDAEWSELEEVLARGE